MANEFENTTFASEKPEPTELERITERITKYRVGITPNNAQTVTTILEKGLQQGIFKLSELDALVSIREEVNRGIIDYNTQVQTAQRRVQELQEEELVAKQAELAKRETARNDELAGERQRRKKAEDEVRILKAQLEALSGVAGNVTTAPVAVEQPHAPKVEKPKSKAWEMVRAGRPLQEEPVVEDVVDLPTILDVPEDSKGTEEFLEEVEKVEEEHNTLSRREEVLLDPLSASQKEEKVESDFKFVEEDVKTKPTFAGPKITGGNAPNIKAVVEEPKTVEAKVEKQIPSFDSEEELLAAAQAKIDAAKAEEEFEEVTIPSESELRAMTKAEILEISKTLGFTNVALTQTKDNMISTFLTETEDFIQSLQDSGEFVSATETEDGKKDGNDDIRDGGYF